MTPVEGFKCDYCKHITLTKSGMYKHEAKCFHNPQMRACHTCSKNAYKGFKCDQGFQYYCKDWSK